MAPEVKIRNLDEMTLQRLKARADEEGRSMESLLRAIVSDAVGGAGVTAADWERLGFEQPAEIVPGRLYEVFADWRHFRVAITRAIGTSSTTWNSSIDELVEIERNVDGHIQRDRVWTNPLGIPDRRLGSTAEWALRDAMHWLSDYVGAGAIGSARRAAEEETQHHPGLHLVVGGLRTELGANAMITWQGRDVARVSIGNLYFVLSRIVDTIVMEPFFTDSGAAAGKQSFLMSTDIARIIAASMRLLVEMEPDYTKARSKAPKA